MSLADVVVRQHTPAFISVRAVNIYPEGIFPGAPTTHGTLTARNNELPAGTIFEA
jgi:hypothetical protein